MTRSFVQGRRFPAQQHPQAIDGRPGRGLEKRYRGFGGGYLGLGVGHIQAAHKAGVMPLLDDVGSVLLRLKVFTGNRRFAVEIPAG